MKRVTFLAALVLLMAAMALKARLVSLPEAPNRVAAGAFDTHRAIARLGRILGDQRPHVVDSAANDAVRARLVAELRGMGLTPVVTDAITCNSARHARAISCARIRNVRATIGPARGRHLLVIAHYDSTPVGPGAADDGIGVAAALETAWLLKDRPLARPVTFLFDEGEEAGLIGARAFLQHDPLAAKVDSAINMEARGVTGPAIMFETSRPNGGALAAFARAAWHPVANSFSTDLYALIPNDTDVSVLKERPWTILNFAIIGNETRYHSAGDTIAALDPGSVRHMGEQALRAATTLAGAPAPPNAGSFVYADIAGHFLVRLPRLAGLALLGALLLGFALLARIRRGGVARGAGAIAAGIAGGALLAFAGETAIGLIRAGAFWRAHPEIIAFAADLSALAGASAALALVARPLARDRLRAAYWLVFLLLGAALCLAAPGAAIFVLFPPLVAGAGMLAEKRMRGAETAASILAWILLFLLWGPLVGLSEVLLDFGAAWIFAALGALILLPALIELEPLARGLPARMLAPGLAGIAALGWAATLLVPAYSADRKQAFGIEYGWDADSKSGRWLVANDGAPLPAGFAGFRGGVKVPWSTRKRWAAAAPAIPPGAPAIDKIAEHPVPGGRLIRFRLRTGGNDAIALRGEKDSGWIAARAGGSFARFISLRGGDPDTWRCLGRSCDGLIVDLLVAGSRPVRAKLIGLRYGLPAAAAGLLRARPANAAPQYAPDTTIAVAGIRL
jgi:hypothetical protein